MKKLVALLCTVALCLCLAGCGIGTSGQDDVQNSSEPQSTEPQNAEPQNPLEEVELTWGDYTIGIDQVTDDQEKINSSSDAEGRLVKVCFYYIKDKANSGGFISESYFDDLEANPFVLRDSKGNTYEYTGTISDIAMAGDFATDGFKMEEIQPRFSVSFDVPIKIELEDLVLDAGDGQEIELVPSPLSHTSIFLSRTLSPDWTLIHLAGHCA